MPNKITTISFQEMKKNGDKISILTAYDYTFAKLIDSAGIDAVLVGDSLGMVALGYPDTTKVTMQDMLHHTKAVVRGVNRAMVISDMPFMSYHAGVYDAVKSAGAFISEGGAQAVKIEGGSEMADEITAIIRAGIPVMGHLGLTPQSVHKFGGYQVQARSKEQADKLVYDAHKLQDIGVFSIVLECIPYELAEKVTKGLSIPTIGIGAGAGCDGQVLVTPDMLGMYKDISPKFVKVYDNVGKKIIESAIAYNDEVKNGMFPAIEHSFK